MKKLILATLLMSLGISACVFQPPRDGRDGPDNRHEQRRDDNDDRHEQRRDDSGWQRDQGHGDDDRRDQGRDGRN